MPPLTPNHLTRRDLGRFLLWFLLQGLIISVLMAALTVLGMSSSFSIPWSLIAIAALLSVVYRRGHYLLVLGLGAAALSAQHSPAFFGYALLLTIPLYALLRWRCSHPKSKNSHWIVLAFWILLGVGLVAFPWILRAIGGNQPASWLWWNGFSAAALFILYARLGFEENSPLVRVGYFEHLGYVLFPVHRIALVPMSPSWFGRHSRASIDGKSYRHAWRAVGLAAAKSILFLILTRLHTAPSNLEEIGFREAWWYLFIHYACWLCWVQAHFDLAVALARTLGIRMPIIYDRPLMALSLTRWWHRFNHLVPHLVRRAVRGIPEPDGLRVGLLVALSYLFIPVGMIGSVFMISNLNVFLCTLIFTAIISVGIGIETFRGNHLFQPLNYRGWARIPRWILTHTVLAIAHLFLLNHGIFSGDPIWNLKERWSILLSLLPG